MPVRMGKYEVGGSICGSCFRKGFMRGQVCFILSYSVLKSYSIQHVPDGTVIVESIVIKVTSSAEEPNLKVILLSWSYQVNKHVMN